MHLLKHKQQLSKTELDSLLNEIEHIDFEQIHSIYNNRLSTSKKTTEAIKPIEATELSQEEEKELFRIGIESIKKNEVAVVLMAGGQGTRLGFDGPKGTFDIGLPSGKSLFHLQADKLLALYHLTETYIPWYIMTSEDNHQETIEHFEHYQFFGYDKNKIYFFKQDRLPLVLENGQIAMQSPYKINMAANGNGGVLSSLNNHGHLQSMKDNNIQHVFLYGVDNAIAKVADPIFIGFAIKEQSQVASKSVDKIHADEKVGVICYRDNHPDIVEYMELPDHMRTALDHNNRLLYRNGNILSYVFSLDFLIDSVSQSIEFHTAHKKVNHFDETLIIPPSPNGYKFELFLFDVFKFTDSMSVLSVKREEEFSPVKNKDGVDSPETARTLILKEHHRWLKNAGYDISLGFEVDTSISYQGENLEDKSLNAISFNRLT